MGQNNYEFGSAASIVWENPYPTSDELARDIPLAANIPTNFYPTESVPFSAPFASRDSYPISNDFAQGLPPVASMPATSFFQTDHVQISATSAGGESYPVANDLAQGTPLVAAMPAEWFLRRDEH